MCILRKVSRLGKDIDSRPRKKSAASSQGVYASERASERCRACQRKVAITTTHAMVNRKEPSVFVKTPGREVSKDLCPENSENMRRCGGTCNSLNRSDQGWRRTVFLRSWSSLGRRRCLFVGARRLSCGRPRLWRAVAWADRRSGRSSSQLRHWIRCLLVRQVVRSSRRFACRRSWALVSSRPPGCFCCPKGCGRKVWMHRNSRAVGGSSAGHCLG
jgi:hypothetical protein